MQQDKIKSLLVNILTAGVIVGVVVVGYIVFTKSDVVPTVGSSAPSTSVAFVAQETAAIGTEIDTTVRDLGELESAVASAAVIFDLPAFKNLEDFSVTVSPENIGRTNPFIPTAWKIKMNAIEAAISGRSASSNTTSAVATQSAQVSSATTADSGAPLGDFSSGI